MSLDAARRALNRRASTRCRNVTESRQFGQSFSGVKLSSDKYVSLFVRVLIIYTVKSTPQRARGTTMGILNRLPHCIYLSSSSSLSPLAPIITPMLP